MFVESLVANLEPTFMALLGAVALVLLIACSNVASLFLGRLKARQKEIAVRQSLGATRLRVVRQFVVEGFVFSIVAGAAGTLVAAWSLSAVHPLIASQLPPDTIVTLNLRALIFTAAVSLITALMVGLVPAIYASREEPADVLRATSRAASARAGTFRNVLIVGEVALSVVLLVGSTLLLISFVKLQQTPPGFEARGAATAFVSAPASRRTTSGNPGPNTNPWAATPLFFDQVIEKLRAQPGVIDAATAISVPMAAFNPRTPYSVAGRPVPPLPQRALANFDVVSDDYFAVMRISFVSGRAFDAGDREHTASVCVVNESLARRLFPGESAIGKVLLRGRNAEIPAEIVGIIRDVKIDGLNVPAPDQIYFPMRQLGQPGMTLIARTSGDAEALQSSIRAAVAAIDPEQALSAFATLETAISSSLGPQRIVASLTAAFAALALVLSAIGLYAVVAYAVSQRTAEIGIRMALGAKRAQVVRLVMEDGLRLVAVGLVAGLIAAAGTARLIAVLLYGVQSLDPAIYAGVGLLFTAVSALACLLPSLRASRIDPVIALGALRTD